MADRQRDRVLVLWDLDGTLVDLGDLSKEIFRTAFWARTGEPLQALPEPLAGRTDAAILLAIFDQHGIPASDLEDWCHALGEAAATLAPHIRNHGLRTPGAREAIAALARNGAVQSLVTGNVREVAETKLTALGLATVELDLDIGGFGSSATDRAELVHLARQRAQHTHAATFCEVVVIGDTPHDITAASRADARPIGVATGPYDINELAAAGADAVLADLTDTNTLTAVVCAT